MIPAPVAHACWVLLVHLIAPAARSLCLGCFAALVMGAFCVKSALARLAIWKAVLYAALAMPLLGWILPPLPFEIPAAAARVVPRNAPFVAALHPNGAAPTAGPSATGPFPPALSLIRHEILSQVGNSTLHPMSARGTSRSDVAPPVAIIPAKAVPAVGESNSSPVIAARDRDSFSWIAALAVTYVSVTLLFFGRLFLGITLSRRLIRAARPIPESEAAALLALHGRPAHPAIPLRLAESELISVPVALGILRPVILFPVEWRGWTPAALRAVIAHERSHVIRRDALTQRLSLLHCAIFWFSPLSWWLHRCLADAAEEASDEAALLSGADRAQYAETLLSFFVALQRTPRRVNWQGVSIAKAGQAEKRVDRILAWKGDVSMRLNKSLAISLLLLGVPLVLFAAAARPSVGNAQEQKANSPLVPAPSKPATTVNPTPNATPPPEVVTAQPAPAILQSAPEPPPPPAPLAVPLPEALGPNSLPLPPVALQLKNVMSDDQIQTFHQDVEDAISRAERSKTEIQEAVELQLQQLQREGLFQIANGAQRMKWRGFDGGFDGRFVIVSGDSPILSSGDSEDVEHATSLRGKIKGDFIWFQRDEKSYLIRDQETVNRAKGLFKSEEELGQKQDALGKQQQTLGDQQRDLGKKMEAVHVQIPDMSADMQKLEAQMKQLSAGGTQEQLGDLQRQIGELQRKIGESQFTAGDQQRQIGEQMRELGRQQGELGRQQGELARQQMEASSQANEQMKQLLDDATAHGTAQPE
jgi:beta-lactamase regulating signal transducer with metallopeptidase domain